MKKESSEKSFELMKRNNIGLVYQTILAHSPLSRSDISVRTGLNKMTVTNCVRSLLETELIYEMTNREGPTGRKPIQLSLNVRAGVLIGVELNILSCQILVTDIAGNILEQRVDTAIAKNPQSFVREISRTARRCREQYGDWKYGVIGVGIALPGNYDRETGCVAYISNMQNWNGFPIIDAFRQELPDVPVACQNAGRAGAIGERYFGLFRQGEHFAYVHGAKGLALSIVDAAGHHAGDRGFQGRFGHMIIDVNGRPCICGNRGCLEQYASVGALGAAVFPDQDFDYLHLQELLNSAREENPEVMKALEEVIFYLAVGIVNIINCFNPHQVCIGGYLGTILQNREKELTERVNSMLLEQFRDEHKIVCSHLDEWGVSYGCIADLRNHLLDRMSL